MKSLMLPVLFGLALAGCSQTDNEALPAATDAVAEVAPPPAAAPTSNRAADAPAAIANTSAVPARQIIYRATLDIKVADLPRATARLDSLTRGSGSWVSQATQSRTDDTWRQETVIRMRPERFVRLLADLSALGTVESKALESEDVTAARADIAARLRTKRAVEQRYIGLLTQSQKVSEVLEVEARLGEVREDIEATESRLKALNDQLTYSTITVRLHQPLALPAPDAPLLSFGSRVAEAFYGGWTMITALVIGAVYLWPLFLLGAGGVWLARLWRRRSAPR